MCEGEGKREEVVLGEKAYKGDCGIDQGFDEGGLVLNWVEIAVVNENERTGEGVEVVEELEEEAFCELKDIDYNVELEVEVVCEEVELGIKMGVFIEKFRG